MSLKERGCRLSCIDDRRSSTGPLFALPPVAFGHVLPGLDGVRHLAELDTSMYCRTWLGAALGLGIAAGMARQRANERERQRLRQNKGMRLLELI